MNQAILLFIGLLIVGLIVVSSTLWIVFWLKTRKIKKKAPEFEGKLNDFKNLNFDRNAFERRNFNNGRTERRVETIRREVTSSTEGEEEEIRRIREQIARAERELTESR